MGAPLAVHFLVVVVAVIGSFAVDEDPAKVCINKSSSFSLEDPPPPLLFTSPRSPHPPSLLHMLVEFHGGRDLRGDVLEVNSWWLF
jgi:hypothetical protein